MTHSKKKTKFSPAGQKIQEGFIIQKGKPLTNKQIFKKAIKKAKKNGLRFYTEDKGYLDDVSEEVLNFDVDFRLEDDEYQSILFNHEFAKAFFSDEKYLWYDSGSPCVVCKRSKEIKCGDESDHLPNWMHHLQQLVILEDKDRFKYLKKFL